MDYVTTAVSEYIAEKRVSIMSLADRTGHSYDKIYPSLKQNPSRKLRGDELLDICAVLEVDPKIFRPSRKHLGHEPKPPDKKAM